MTDRYIWENGSVLDWKKGTTHVMNPSMHYGVAAFEGIRFYNTPKGPAIFRLTDHLDRFFYSMKVLGMPTVRNHWELGSAIKELIRRNKMTEGYIRPIAWFSDEKIGLHNAGGVVSIQIALFDWQNTGKDTLNVQISRFLRIHPKTTDVEAKIAGHYVNTHLALMHAGKRGFDDAILLDHDGNIAEASAANMFCVQKGALYTPQRGTILNGITRQTVLELARDAGYEAAEIPIHPFVLLDSNEVFLCGTAYEIKPVARIEDTVIGDGTPGPFTRWIQKQYRKAVHGELPKHEDWLTYVNP